jgi:SAM-dependent methyltransferase
LCLKQINNLDQFVSLLKEERELIKKFMNENQSQSIKWYPKFACKYVKNNNKLHTELINNIIIGNNEVLLETIKSSEPFNCDGLIITPLNGEREIKIKPKSMMSIDLLYENKKWLDRDLIDWSNIIVKPTGSKKEGKIYRCYPELDTLPELKFKVGEFRYDKKNPNPNIIVDTIINIIKYDWNKDLEDSEIFYYDQNKKISSRNLIETISAQNDLLEQKIYGLEPSFNKNWLDLGCGKGKLIPLIKKFNPKKYLGLDADVKQLVRALKYHDANQNVYQFSPCNLADKWSNTSYKWQSINTNIKYDYVIANFSIMHFFTNEFWNQLNEIVHEETKFLFNIVNVKSETKWTESESFLEVVDGVTKYKFEWTHTEVKTEPYIDQIQIEETLKSYGWKILNNQDINSKYPLINMYKWLIIQKC